MERERYLVPFGREPGGLLEFLGLPGTADPKEIGDQRNVKKSQIKANAKKQTAEQRAKLDKGEITQAEYDERAGKIDDELTAALIHLNKLVGAYDAGRAQERGAAKQDRKLVRAGWIELAEADVTEESLLERRPLPRIDDATLAQLVAEADTGASPKDVREVVRWCVRRDLMPLLEADELWGRCRGAARSEWARRLDQWRAELEQAAPGFTVRAGHPAAGEAEYPHLAGRRSRAIRELSATPVPDDAPSRRAAASPISMETLLALLANDLDPASEGRPGPEMPLQLRALLEHLAVRQPRP